MSHMCNKIRALKCCRGPSSSLGVQFQEGANPDPKPVIGARSVGEIVHLTGCQDIRESLHHGLPSFVLVCRVRLRAHTLQHVVPVAVHLL